MDPTWRLQVAELIARGRKIQAIKVVRESTGLGLAASKKYVESLAAGQAPPYDDVGGDSLADRPEGGAPGNPPAGGL